MKGNERGRVTQWGKALLEKLIVAQLMRKSPEIYGARKFLPGPYHEPDKSSLHLAFLLL
jgi:hypothetical protein